MHTYMVLTPQACKGTEPALLGNSKYHRATNGGCLLQGPLKGISQITEAERMHMMITSAGLAPKILGCPALLDPEGAGLLCQGLCEQGLLQVPRQRPLNPIPQNWVSGMKKPPSRISAVQNVHSAGMP